ncbi:MAG TPA: hypothetical protein VJ960_02780 [Oceanipulchritudo sp.]|nr:hypothetical protein [Oceanipulchritudo sp.]
MKTKATRKQTITIALIFSTLALALPLEAGRGGQGGHNGDCPNGYEPGTRAMEDCVRPADSSGSRHGQAVEGRKQGAGNRLGDGKGQGNGPRRDGSGGRGAGDPESCPNYTGPDPQP